ncbi:hypothetical protein [Undibacterium sp. Ji22W]|uniref:hypothetical protein n=1 Tax=Undibacterium sp. Ji22W TaxID=3413038 RepID=UPI003BF1D9DD
MSQNAAPFPNPPIPDTDTVGLRVPPWVKYPNIPHGSIGWRMGAGEDCWDSFRDWWMMQPGVVRLQVKTTYPEPELWSGFYSRLKSNG